MLREMKDVKSLVMIVMSLLEKKSANTLVSAVLETGLADLVDIDDALCTLDSDGLVVFEKGNNCYLSEKGRSILSEVSGFFTSGTLEEIERSVSRYIEREDKKTEYFSELIKQEENWKLVCTCSENKVKVCEICLVFDKEKDAIYAKNNFEKRPKAVINAIKASVTGKVDFLM